MSLWPVGPGPDDTGAHRVRIPGHGWQRRPSRSRWTLGLVAALMWLWLAVVAALGLSGCSSTQAAKASHYVPVVLEAASTFSKAAREHLRQGSSVEDMPVQCSTEWVPSERMVLLLCEGRVPRGKDEKTDGAQESTHESRQGADGAREGIPFRQGRKGRQGQEDDTKAPALSAAHRGHFGGG